MGAAYRRCPDPESTAELLARLPYPGAFHPNLMGGLSVEAVVERAKELLEKTNGVHK